MIDKKKYTHYAHVLWIPAYYNVETQDLAGQNWFYDFLIEWVAFPLQASVIFVLSWLDPEYEPMWMIGLGEEIEKQ